MRSVVNKNILEYDNKTIVFYKLPQHIKVYVIINVSSSSGAIAECTHPRFQVLERYDVQTCCLWRSVGSSVKQAFFCLRLL